MSEHQSPQSELEIVSAIGDEFERVSKQRRRGARRLPAVLLRSRRTTALAVAAGLVAAGGAGAASGVLSVGDVIPADEPSSPPDNVPETVLATGSSPVAGPWRMTSYTSEQSIAQPAGLPCVRLVLTEPPKATPIAGTGFCGEVGQDFSGVSLPVIDGSGGAELLVFGVAPEGAAAVELTSDAGNDVRSQTQEGPTTRGDVFVMKVPPGADKGELKWLDQNGKAGSKKVDATGFFDRMKSVQRFGSR